MEAKISWTYYFELDAAFLFQCELYFLCFLFPLENLTRQNVDSDYGEKTFLYACRKLFISVFVPRKSLLNRFIGTKEKLSAIESILRMEAANSVSLAVTWCECV